MEFMMLHGIVPLVFILIPPPFLPSWFFFVWVVSLYGSRSEQCFCDYCSILFHYDIDFVHFLCEAVRICEINARKCIAGSCISWRQTFLLGCKALYIFLFKKHRARRDISLISYKCHPFKWKKEAGMIWMTHFRLNAFTLSTSGKLMSRRFSIFAPLCLYGNLLCLGTTSLVLVPPVGVWHFVFVLVFFFSARILNLSKGLLLK